MIRRASSVLHQQIQAGKVELILADVAELPFESDTFDHVYHCNCYYFWDDQVACAKELHRVMKPNANMIAAFNEQELKEAIDAGLLKYGNPDPQQYMESLRKAGFQSIESKQLKNIKGHAFNAVFCCK
jgi:ubiquinone/menaquinone biosynthesis C-methylase UbiE